MGRVQAVPQPPVGASYNGALGEGLLQQRPLRGHAITVPSEEGFLRQRPLRGHTKQGPPSGGHPQTTRSAGGS